MRLALPLAPSLLVPHKGKDEPFSTGPLVPDEKHYINFGNFPALLILLSLHILLPALRTERWPYPRVNEVGDVRVRILED